MASPLVIALLAAVCWVMWKVFREYIVRSPLDNIPGPPRGSFWSGNTESLYANRTGWAFHDKICDQYGPVAKIYSTFGKRSLYVYDPKALNSIMIKDEYTYSKPQWLLQSNNEIIGPGLFVAQGDQHRRQRRILNPVFSIAHMRFLTPTFYKVVHRLHEAISAKVGGSSGEVDMVEWMSRTALELIGQGGLGYSFDPLVAQSTNPFGVALKALIPLVSSLHIYRVLMPYVAPYVPARVLAAFMRWVPHADAQRLRAVTAELWAHSQHIYDTKRAALAAGDADAVHQVGERRDLISVLIQANDAAAEEDRLPDEEVVAQIVSMLLAATDTTSSALARIFTILAERQDVQDKLRAEIFEAAGGGTEDIPYDQLVELPYLDAIIRETMRLHPPANFVNRETRTDIVMPLSEPISGLDGSLISEVPVPAGTPVVVSVRGCNRNRALWGDDALEWKPERWLRPHPAALLDAHVPGVYANLMTFIGGPRGCIGFKFSQLEMKVALAVLLRSFRFRPSEKEIFWNLSGVSFPTVGEEGSKPMLPMKVEAIQV
ncbi:cytochrome P450 [Phanerochaete sordida]|uniref:Cytochrome P450 n=1 Tax=Phanerochaete sordida TaxID=48140 RepID=A0A9P3GMU9_9APHY|nr:cytochrome P450 [Phanerochaete sordida]